MGADRHRRGAAVRRVRHRPVVAAVKVDRKVSKYIIDRRKPIAAGAVACLISAVLAVLGVNLFTGSASDPDRDLVFEVSTAIDRAQDFYASRFPGYQPANVVIFDRSTQTACGVGLASSGPFLCSVDQRAYVDLAFLRAIGSPLARSYVIAHELAHEVQVSLHRMSGRPQVYIELEADCLAGSWVRDEQRRGNLAAGDIEAALELAAQVGDDRIAPASSPETWRHGSSSQRVAAFRNGLDGLSCFGS